VKHIKNFTIFLFESEEFTKEDYLNWKQCLKNRGKGIPPTEEEIEAKKKYHRMKNRGLDPIAPFRKKEKEEEFTEEDYRNYKEYNRKRSAKPKLEPTRKEREAFNKYSRKQSGSKDPIAPFRKKEGEDYRKEFSEEDYRNFQEYNRKINAKPKLEPTQKEREAYNKYQRQRKISNPIAPFRKKEKEEEFTEEDYRNYQEYNRKKYSEPRLEPTQKEKEAYNKYQRMLTRGLDPTDALTGKIRIITATGDWSKLTLDGSPLFLSHANTYFVTFYKNPTKEMIKRLLGDNDHTFTCDPKEASQEIFGGDHNGPYICNSLNKKEGLIFAADPKYSPVDYENELVRTAKTICENPDENENMDGEYALHILEHGWQNFTPEYISHLILLASESAKKPSRYTPSPKSDFYDEEDRRRISLFLKFAEYNLKGQPLKLMDPRIEIKFKVV